MIKTPVNDLTMVFPPMSMMVTISQCPSRCTLYGVEKAVPCPVLVLLMAS